MPEMLCKEAKFCQSSNLQFPSVFRQLLPILQHGIACMAFCLPSPFSQYAISHLFYSKMCLSYSGLCLLNLISFPTLTEEHSCPVFLFYFPFLIALSILYFHLSLIFATALYMLYYFTALLLHSLENHAHVSGKKERKQAGSCSVESVCGPEALGSTTPHLALIMAHNESVSFCNLTEVIQALCVLEKVQNYLTLCVFSVFQGTRCIWMTMLRKRNTC